MLITINQDTDTPARREALPGLTLTYLYDRSRDSKVQSAPGQDFIAYHYDEGRFAFAVCDGVSQSFYGELAARFLGERLVNWLTELPVPATPEQLADQANRALRGWVAEAQAMIDAKVVTPSLPPMVREALERKRSSGSESIFLAGLLDIAQNKLAVCWMGDTRLWMWDADGVRRELPNAIWEMRERWSSRTGPKNGSPRAALVPLDELRIVRISVHTDGLAGQVDALQSINLDALNAAAGNLSRTPGSDDVAVLDINLNPLALQPLDVPAPRQDTNGEPVITWAAVPDADWYRVALENGARSWTVDISDTTYFLPADLTTQQAGLALCRVQALASDRAPSAWSAPVVVAEPQAESLTEAVPPESAPAAPMPETVLVEVEEGTANAFAMRPVLALSLLLALALSIAWYAMNMRF